MRADERKQTSRPCARRRGPSCRMAALPTHDARRGTHSRDVVDAPRRARRSAGDATARGASAVTPRDERVTSLHSASGRAALGARLHSCVARTRAPQHVSPQGRCIDDDVANARPGSSSRRPGISPGDEVDAERQEDHHAGLSSMLPQRRRRRFRTPSCSHAPRARAMSEARVDQPGSRRDLDVGRCPRGRGLRTLHDPPLLARRR